MQGLSNFRPVIIGMGVGAIAGGGVVLGSRGTDSDNATAKMLQQLPATMTVMTLDTVVSLVKSGNPAQYGTRAFLFPAVMTMGMVTGANALLNTATTYNTIDRGLNALEQDSFTQAHHRRAAIMPVVGAGAGAAFAAAAARIAKVPVTPANLLQQSAMGTLIGAGIAVVTTTNGQDHPYAPSTDRVDLVTDALWRGIGGNLNDPQVNPALAGDVPVTAGGRSHADAANARFYATTDARGNADGMLQRDELRKLVEGFDVNGDGRVSSADGEWAPLHAAVVEGVTN